MPTSQKILLVEGDSDKSFFEKICKKLSLDNSVQVAPPKDVGGGRNSKEGVFQRLEILLPQLADGQLTHIAVVIDADYVECNGLGLQRTIERVSKIVKPFDFELRQDDRKKGLYFKHSDGFSDFGLWVMPDNENEGMLEDWIKPCIKNDESELFEKASQAVASLSSPKFKPHLKTKAKIATWLAWQKQPGHGLYWAIKENLLDEDIEYYKNLENWLVQIFQ
ncbi:hypothetical protein QUF61_00520 [Candidatus Venteria ishoeyi]|uniref:DUF3226 domain-containing protein n=1 Tax=Candidatus Venteria ishoeyi TaxID=1899563 RepID=UPI0025A57497|nr:DUF3226 domain-containing protein [Candidatus Venteria ishoeyi]MDM8544953.1 hypothetical protein [Candidatus Venteria ishoeyi]